MFRAFDRKGEERYMFPWMFVAWGFVSIVVIGVVVLFWGAEADIRGEEAELLAERLGDCLSEMGKINEEMLKPGVNVFEVCRLDSAILRDSGDFYFRISFLDAESAREIREPIEVGNFELELECELTKRGKSSARCDKEVIFVSRESDGSDIAVEIVTASDSLGDKL